MNDIQFIYIINRNYNSSMNLTHRLHFFKKIIMNYATAAPKAYNTKGISKLFIKNDNLHF